MRQALRLALLLLALAAPLSACASGARELRPEVVEAYPHDTAAFTQGLLFFEGRLYESTGQYGESSLREVDPETGEVLRVRYLPASLFGEGLALVADRLIMLTWREETALIFRRDDFEPLGSFSYGGQGWGLCFDGEQLWMSDGTATLASRDPDTFVVTGRVQVTRDGEPVERLNELECVGRHVYANVWLTDTIVRIDKASGRVDGVIDASGLLTAQERATLSPDAVLNGIAYDEQRELFYVTGKLWPRLFLVRFE